jgi:hypothetical protein
MDKPRYSELREFKRVDRNWVARFSTNSDFIGQHSFEVTVSAKESDDRDAPERSVEDCVRRARKHLAAGLLIAAEEAMSAIPEEDQDTIIKILQTLKKSPGTALFGAQPDVPL